MMSDSLLVSPSSLMMVNCQRPVRGNLVRTGRLDKLEFRGPVKFQLEFISVAEIPNLPGNASPARSAGFKYSEKALEAFPRSSKATPCTQSTFSRGTQKGELLILTTIKCADVFFSPFSARPY
jgi:hypothetical protein